jgi:two-component system sensor histidine kinase DegS
VETVLNNREQEGYGLTGIRERVRFLKGDVHIHSAPGAGTAVLVSIPLVGQRRKEK